MSSPRASAWPRAISRAGRPAPSGCSESSGSTSKRNDHRRGKSEPRQPATTCGLRRRGARANGRTLTTPGPFSASITPRSALATLASARDSSDQSSDSASDRAPRTADRSRPTRRRQRRAGQRHSTRWRPACATYGTAAIPRGHTQADPPRHGQQRHRRHAFRRTRRITRRRRARALRHALVER